MIDSGPGLIVTVYERVAVAAELSAARTVKL
jgi:hypothetical protein